MLASAEKELTALVYAPLIEEWSEATVSVDPLNLEGSPTAAPSDFPDRVLSDEELPAALDRYLAKLERADLFSGAVLITRAVKPSTRASPAWPTGRRRSRTRSTRSSTSAR